MVDINKAWKDLDPRAQADNRTAAHDAYRAVTKFPKDREAAAAFVHECWIKRNKRDPNQPKKLFYPYQKLSEAEKNKDRQHVDVMKAALAGVKKQTPKAAPRKAAKKRTAKRSRAKALVAMNAATARKLQSIATELSALLGRRVSAEQLALAGARAILALYKAGLD
jgi:hypothetical protein